MAAVLLNPKGSSEDAAIIPPSVGGGDEKSRSPSPSSAEGTGAVVCPLTGAEHEVVTFPCWFVELSLMLHELFPWRLVGQKNVQSGEGYAGGGPHGPLPRW